MKADDELSSLQDVASRLKPQPVPSPKVLRAEVISEMVAIIHSGKGWADAKAVNEVQWGMTNSSFNRCWKMAQTEHTDMIIGVKRQVRRELEENEIEQIRAGGEVQKTQMLVAHELERLQGAILSREEGLQILSDIARGRSNTKKHGKGGTAVDLPPTPMERIMALKLIAEIDYWTLPQEETEDATLVEFTDAE